MDVEMDGEYLTYLYCVTAEPPDPDRVGEPSDGLYRVCEAGLCAVASRVKTSEFGPSSLRQNLDDLVWVATETTRHERIVEGIMRNTCVIPFRFATLFAQDENLRTLLRERAEEFTALLEQLDDKAEWGVKVFCDAEKASEHACAQDDAICGLDETIRSASSGKAFLLKKKRDDLARTALAGRIDRSAERIAGILQELSVRTRIGRVSPHATNERRGVMVLNSSFLVRNDETPRFLDCVAALNENHRDSGIVVECTGPWPPYNFCDFAKQVGNG